MIPTLAPTRRRFLRAALIGSFGALAGRPLAGLFGAEPSSADGKRARVALTAGEDRPGNVFEGLRFFRDEIAQAIGARRVVIKPNNVSIGNQLSATHAAQIEGILEFLKSIGKLQGAIIAESAADGPTLDGFANYGYDRLAEKYGVRLVDLDQEETRTLRVFDERDFRPHPVRMSRLLLDRESFYVISAAKMKTHDRVLATLSLKNIVFGAPTKDLGFTWGPRRKPGATTQKPIAHGSGIYGINYNLFALAERLGPDLAVIDGYRGMEGNGPTSGAAVEHRVCVVSPDWLAADRVAIELMGIDFAMVGYLNYAAEAGLGTGELAKIEVLGEPIARHVRRYKLHDNLQKQLMWRTPPEEPWHVGRA